MTEKLESTGSAEHIGLDTIVAKVLVMEDRAQITRRGRAQLRAGKNTVVVAGVTPLVADNTVRCRLLTAGAPVAEAGARILDVSTRRDYVVRTARPDNEREIRQAIDKAVAEYVTVYDGVMALVHDASLLEQSSAQLARHVCDRLGIGAFDSSVQAEIEKLFAGRAEIETRVLAEQWEQDDRKARIFQLARELAIALTPVSEYHARIDAQLWVETAGAYEVELEYLVPCALWRPEYVAELTTGGGRPHVRWISGGTVWQATGEDWQKAAVALSTARPTLGASLAYLDDDWLDTREKTEEEKTTIEVTSRDEEIQTTTPSESPEKKSDTPPGVDDGGEARTFLVPGEVTVPTDGRPHRLVFETFQAEAETSLVAMPWRAPFVFLRSLQVNASKMPLLAGPVALVKDGGFVGRTEIKFVAPAERFELSWGSQDNWVVLRNESRGHKETAIRKRHEYTYEIRIYLANHSAEPGQVRLVERVPVSEIDAVKVEIASDKTSAGFDKDAQGLVTWQVSLAPRGEQRLTLGFTLGMPANVRFN